jgi:hypothetical protein
MDVVLVLVVLVAVVLLIAAPLRRPRSGPEEVPGAARRADLEAAKEAKYREIRDAELDYRTGKLAREDWERLDATLRADALELLQRLEGVGNGADRPG